MEQQKEEEIIIYDTEDNECELVDIGEDELVDIDEDDLENFHKNESESKNNAEGINY